ncbi:CdaR family protein [Deinococcus maricopensis]|uniref:YbbR family protein n=1 Tax=Deinococcus maricopensis (strain DSM 21211 / LMG 22137 / NRRL B-23946 / LB-34) TaxID=709986 RepID=E8U5G8_DEIML|nr:hypothetical protein [Deinococcus maricopensis]ADV66307.1 YbbR family protein [Deinococcus maricopensis DSM 21211]
MTPLTLLRRLLTRTTHNGGAKFLALLAATAVWFVATADRRAITERSLNVPLVVRDETTGAGRRGVSGLATQTIRVTVSGPRTRLTSLPDDAVRASIDVTGAAEGTFTRTVRVTAPDDVRINRYAPESVSGFVDAEITRTMPVSLAVSGGTGNALPRYTLTPSSVQVRGPQRNVEEVRRVITLPITVAPGADTEARLLALDANDRPVTDLRLIPASVTVSRVDTGTLPVRTARVTLPDPPATLTVASATVTPTSVRLVGPPGVLADLTEVPARLTYAPGRNRVRANLTLPDGVRALDTVTVTLDVRRK